MSNTNPLPSPPEPDVSVATVTSGPPIPAIERIKLFSNQEWEEFVLEWADGLRSKYMRVERCGGAGDMGRDVIALPDAGDTGTWDNFQCKHYDHPLRASEIWLELGKLVHYTRGGEFTYPRSYTFVSPLGAGTALSKLLKDADKLRQGLMDAWDTYCKNGITSTTEVVLDSELRNYVTSLDFGIFDCIPPLRLIDEHRETPWHLARFGGGLPQRPAAAMPPATPDATEMEYLRKLFEAYGDHLHRDVKDQSDIGTEDNLQTHYKDSRVEFYSAESLRGFSRDTLPPGSYEQLQEEVHDGIRDEIRSEHDDGYARLLAVVATARALQLTSHALVQQLRVRDRGGICHQLANDRVDVQWVRP